MSSEDNYMKHAHTEGFTFVCYEEKGRYLLTCGSDGYVKIWDGIEDDDPVSKHVAENALSLAVIKERYFVGSDSNSVLAYTFPKSVADGLITRFTAQVTHVVASVDGKSLLIGSCDFSIKYVELSDNSFKVLLGHEAPILSVALDPQGELAASSSCDGTVRVWQIAKQKCIKSWAAVFPTSNDFSTSKVCCRIAWQPQKGKYLAVPVDKSVKLYNREKWDETKNLTHSSITELVNVVCFTKCGGYLTAGCVNGIIVVWSVTTFQVVKRLKHEKDLTICSMVWNPNGNGNLTFTDLRGHMYTFKDVLSTQDLPDPSQITNPQDLVNADDDDDDENSFSISKIKAELDLSKFEGDDEQVDDVEDKSSVQVKPNGNAVASVAHLQPQLQSPFQPGSTPVHFQRRFMMWNSVGIVRCFNTEEENAIEIEFHDNNLHHSIHLENLLRHTMADVSNTAVVLACKPQPSIPSQFVCLHFASWDNHKQWGCEMPEGESIEAITVTDEWVAVVTSLRQIRFFSIGGVQCQVLTLTGPVVAAAGHQNQFLITYHRGLGCLAAMLVQLDWKSLSVSNITLPISADSSLAWMGFTDEGTPCAVDSSGIVRSQLKSAGDCWMQIANTKSHTKGVSDHHFVVGISEIQQQIRCIPCKGSRYPPTLPHPTLVILPFQLPLCGMSTQFGQMEEGFRRTKLLSDILQDLDGQGYETDTMQVQRTQQQQKESLMKLFALACRNDHEFRAVELAKMMDSYHTVQLAIRYAAQLKHFHLADKLGEIAYEKLEEENANENNEEEAAAEEEKTSRKQNKNTNQRSSGDNSQNQGNDVIEESQELFEDVAETPQSIPILSNEVRHNPFKVTLTPSSRQGVDVFDSMKLNGKTNKKGNKEMEKVDATVKVVSTTMDKYFKNKPENGETNRSKIKKDVVKAGKRKKEDEVDRQSSKQLKRDPPKDSDTESPSQAPIVNRLKSFAYQS